MLNSIRPGAIPAGIAPNDLPARPTNPMAATLDHAERTQAAAAQERERPAAPPPPPGRRGPGASTTQAALSRLLPSRSESSGATVRLHNFAIVTDKLARSAAPKAQNLGFVHAENIVSIINLQRRGERDPFERDASLRCVHLPIDAHWCAKDRKGVPLLQALVNELANLQPGEKALVHCTHGNDRTGFLIFLFQRVIMDLAQDDAITKLYGKMNRRDINWTDCREPVVDNGPRDTSPAAVEGVHYVWRNIKNYAANLADPNMIRELRQQVAGLTAEESARFNQLAGARNTPATLGGEYRMLMTEVDAAYQDLRTRCNREARRVSGFKDDARTDQLYNNATATNPNAVREALGLPPSATNSEQVSAIMTSAARLQELRSITAKFDPLVRASQPWPAPVDANDAAG